MFYIYAFRITAFLVLHRLPPCMLACILRPTFVLSASYLHCAMMRDLSPAALICAVFSGLFGLAHMFRPWNSPLQKWKLCNDAARRILLLLSFYFTAYFTTIFVIFLEVTSHSASKLLFELCWLNGLCVQVRIILFLNATTNQTPGCLSPENLFNTVRNPCIAHTSYTAFDHCCDRWLTSSRRLCGLIFQCQNRETSRFRRSMPLPCVCCGCIHLRFKVYNRQTSEACNIRTYLYLCRC